VEEKEEEKNACLLTRKFKLSHSARDVPH
jgi:hypothetical protein